MNTTGNHFAGLPTVVMNLLILNALVFLFTLLNPIEQITGDLNDLLGLHYFTSPLFRPWQLLTHMFMHGGIGHIFMNMLGLFMLGPKVEYRWGSQRFLTYYLLCGFGAALLYMGWLWFGAHEALAVISSEDLNAVRAQVVTGAEEGMRYSYNNPMIQQVYSLLSTTMVGASGALFGVLIAFGMLYPNVEMIMLMFPIPIKAKWFVVIYGAIELFSGVAQVQGDNVAHFAHLGGMVAGFVLVRIFERNNTFYDNPWQ